jgi:hypothetical protein
MEKAYAFNHGVYKEVIQQKLEELVELREQTKDPYEQIDLDDARKMVDELFRYYKKENLDKIVQNMNSHNGIFNHGLYKEYLTNKLNQLAFKDRNEEIQWKQEELTLKEKAKKDEDEYYSGILAQRRAEEARKRKSAIHKQEIIRELIKAYEQDMKNQIK